MGIPLSMDNSERLVEETKNKKEKREKRKDERRKMYKV